MFFACVGGENENGGGDEKSEKDSHLKGEVEGVQSPVKTSSAP